MNSKMQVYSGSKCAYLPKMMTLHEQCIRVLKNNIDSIFEVGGVPYSVLEPVLERCTPDQLDRIEEYNHVLIEETDQLWKVHCHRDFKDERPKSTSHGGRCTCGFRMHESSGCQSSQRTSDLHTPISPKADKQKWLLSTLWPSHLVMFEGGRRNLEQEEQLCLKKSGKTSAPLWFCLLRERALGQEAIHFV